jgi:hypothetical protein
MRSNSAVFIPWIDEADGHRRSAICSSSEIGGDGLGTATIRISIEKAAVLGGQEFARRQKFLLGQQRRHQSGERAAALVEFHRRRSPRREGAGRLAAGETERLGHGFGVELPEPPDRGGGPERSQHARAVPTLGPHRRVVDPDAHSRRHLASGGDGDQQVAARGAIAFGDRQGGRDHLRRHMGQRRPMDVAHGDGGDEIAVQNGRAGERQPVAADDAALAGLRQPRGERRELLGLLAAVPGDRASQGVQQDILAVIADLSRKIVVLQRRRKAGQHLGDVTRHRHSPCTAFFEEGRIHVRRSIDRHRSWNPRARATSHPALGALGSALVAEIASSRYALLAMTSSA